MTIDLRKKETRKEEKDSVPISTEKECDTI